ncbi:MAG: Transcriptional regulator, AcrR family [Candidatus Kapaibacterium sp.]|nr:MAG: Transcriptional regulator, AcrR family [Candidatus Kapabacteria bacterium]
MPKDETQEKEPRERILEAAATLFSTKGYAAVGVREIAELANVNVAMISYYFSGKAGILKEIVLRYFDSIKAIYDKVLAENYPPETKLRKIVDELVELMKNKTIFCKVAITEMPFDLPEFADFKAEVARRHVEYIKLGLKVFEIFPENQKFSSIITPAALSLIFSHFLFYPIIPKVWQIEIDDEYYDLYSKTISTLLLDGLNGVMKQFINNKIEDGK